MKTPCAILSISLVLTGCLAGNSSPSKPLRSAGYAVTYQSFPESATVVCNGISKGQTPVTVRYHAPQNLMEDQMLTIDRCKAVWMSGAEQYYPETIPVDFSLKGSTIGVERPKNVPGLQQDMAFDHQQRVSALERKAQEEKLNLEKERLKLEKARQNQRLEDYFDHNPVKNNSDPKHYPYSKTTFDVYYGTQKIEGANARSFEVLNHGYAKDVWGVYYLGRKIKEAHSHRFEVLAPNYAKDTWNVYYQNKVIDGANPSSFKVLGQGYAKDVWNVYYHAQKLEGANPATFKVNPPSK